MRILHTIYDDFENPWCGGGGALRTLEISRCLADEHDITLLMGAYPGAKMDEERDGIRIRRIGSDHSYPLSRASFAVLASREISRFDFDLWVYQFSAYSPLLASSNLRDRCLLECMHLLADHAVQKYPVFGHLVRKTEAMTLGAYEEILTISPTVSQQIQQMVNHQNLHLVYTGVNSSCFHAPFSEQDYILYFGRLDTYTKGIDILLQAFARVHDSHPEIRLILAGRGTEERQKELLDLSESLGIESSISFTGPVSEEEKISLFGGALFLCMPSRYEGWGIVAIEAGAAKKAVIGTKIPGLADAIRAGETGLLVPPEDPHSLAIAMNELLEKPDRRRQLGVEGHSWAEQFTWDRIAQEQNRVYKEVFERIQMRNPSR